MIGWRIPLATICLLVGVSFATDPSAAWRAIGGVFLVFVPALITDHVFTALGERSIVRRAAPPEQEQSYQPEYPPVPLSDEYPTELLPAVEAELDSRKDWWNEQSKPSGG